MKHRFHILIALALLIGSLIIFHHLNSASVGQAAEVPDLEHIELAAEVPALRINDSRIQPDISYPVGRSLLCSANLRDPASPDTVSFQVSIKIQRDIYQELRPVLDFGSGQYLYHPSAYGDPPGFRS